MRKVNKFYLLVLLIIPVFIYLSFIVYAKQMTKPLKGLVVKELRVNGFSGKYDVIDGEILKEGKPLSTLTNFSLYKKLINLGAFYRITREDPLFVSPELDAEKLSKSLEVLKITHKELLKKLNTKEAFVPLNFLEAISPVAKAQQIFLSKPTSQNARNLVAKYKAGQDSYKKDIQHLIAKAMKAFPGKKTQTIVNLDSTTNNNIILSDLSLMLKNADELDAQIALRAAILDGEQPYPEIEQVQLEDLIHSKPATDMLKENELFIHPAKQRLRPLGGPYEMTSANFGSAKTKLFYIYTLKSISKNLETAIPKLATNNYYQPFRAHIKTEKVFLEQGYKYYPVHESNTYRVFELEYQPALITLDAFIRKYSRDKAFSAIVKRPFFAKLDETAQAFFQKAKKVEEEFFAQKIPLDANLTILSDFYLKGYQLLKEGETNTEVVNTQEELLKRYLMIKNKMNDLHMLFNSTLYLDNLLTRAKLGNIMKRAIPYLSVVRSAYPLSFFNFSQAVWRLKKKPVYLKPLRDGGKLQKFKKYNQLLDKFDKQEILSWNQFTEGRILFGDAPRVK